MTDTTIKLHELTHELDPEEAGLMKQQSRIEEARRIRRARQAEDVEADSAKSKG